MKEFNDILDAFLVEIEANPNKDIDEIITETAGKLKDSDNRLSSKGLSTINESLTIMDEIAIKLKELKKAKDDGYTRDDWFVERINKKVERIPRLSEEQKIKIVSSIYQSVKDALKKQ